MPPRRATWTQKATVGGLKLYLSCGEYEDGTLGELFLNTDVNMTDDNLRAMLSNFAIAVSLGLQHGVPLRSFVDKFAGTRFGPGGVVQGSERIKLSGSVLDWVFRELALRYLGMDEVANVEPL